MLSFFLFFPITFYVFMFFFQLSYSFVFFFFFSSRRRHTRSTRDWSSDVCSSDLPRRAREAARLGAARRRVHRRRTIPLLARQPRRERRLDVPSRGRRHAERSEERRVGKECRSRWSPYHEKKKKSREETCGQLER